jgi:predicted dehydrogenase
MMDRRTLLAAAGASALARGANAAIGETKPERIKVGQIGVGHAHASKLAVFRQSDDYEVVGIAEPDAGLRKRAQSQEAFRDLPWMTQEQLLNVPGLKLVLVETRVRDLLNAAEACVAAGKHVHLDKPAGTSLPHYRRILESARRQELLVQMGYMFRYNPAVVKLRELVRQGWLGDLFEVHAVISKVVAPADRQRLAEYRGGIQFELGCHVLDLAIALLGKPANVIGINRHASPIKDDLVDNMLAVLEYERAIATVKSSAQEVEGFARRHLTACGTEGTFHIQPLDSPQVRVALSKARGNLRPGYQDLAMPKYVRYVDDAADMARVIRGEKASDFSYDHDLTVQETLLRACELPLKE